MIDVSPEYLLNTVDEETLMNLCESLAGMRVYFKAITYKHLKIKKDYRIMQKQYITKANAVKQLMCKYEMSESQIRNIIRQ